MYNTYLKRRINQFPFDEPKKGTKEAKSLIPISLGKADEENKEQYKTYAKTFLHIPEFQKNNVDYILAHNSDQKHPYLTLREPAT